MPFVLITMTSFVKIAVVLSIVRSAIGTPQVPPSPVITGLALLLTAQVMAPVVYEVHARATPLPEAKADDDAGSPPALALIRHLAAAAREPVQSFLTQHSRSRDRALFVRLARASARPGAVASDLAPDHWLVLVPAFLVSQLTRAFEIGFVVFIPFLVIDLIVANILLALGMQMLAPTTISLPFKLLLFVLLDGWHELSKTLVLGYTA